MPKVNEYEGSINSNNKLSGNAQYWITISQRLILRFADDPYKISVLCYLLFNRTLISKVNYNIKDLIIECGYFPKYGKNSISEKIMNSMRDLHNMGLITIYDYDKVIDNETKIKASGCLYVNYDVILKLNNDKNIPFAVLYYDEFLKISALGNNHTTSSMILLTYLYIKSGIHRRSVIYNTEDGYSLEERRKYIPEAYDDYYSTIGNILNISRKNIAGIIDTLVQDDLLRIFRNNSNLKSDNQFSAHYRRSTTVFVLPYKRVGSIEYEYGQEYYEREAQNKLLQLNKRYKIKEKGGDEYELQE